jgi:hypothetical protein
MAKPSKRKPAPPQQRKELTHDETQDFLRIVRDDLALLQALNFSKPSRAEVRVASSILRRLLHEGMYSNGWRIAGFADQPSFVAVDLLAAIDGIDPKYIHYAYAGGAKTMGAQHSGHGLFVVPKEEAEVEGTDTVIGRLNANFRPGLRRTFTLAEFCASPSV